MWSMRRERIADCRGLKFHLESESRPVSFGDVLVLLQSDAEFRAFFNSTLADVPFSAFRWETPPITTATRDRPFEFVVLDSPELVRAPDVHAFTEHFKDPTSGEFAVSFPNLGNDAIMIVPKPVAADLEYVHLAAFVRGAPGPQQHAFWSLVGSVVEERLSTSPLWLSTAGAGVAWLHVRVDTRPKYYGYAPYRQHAPNRR